MNKDENNRYIHVEIMGKCWHESEAVGEVRHGGYYCRKCGSPDALRRVPLEFENGGHPDYYTPEGFFALLDGLRVRQIGVSLMQYSDGASVVLSAWNRNHAGLITPAKANDLPTALVEAAIQAMENENG